MTIWRRPRTDDWRQGVSLSEGDITCGDISLAKSAGKKKGSVASLKAIAAALDVPLVYRRPFRVGAVGLSVSHDLVELPRQQRPVAYAYFVDF